MPKIIRNWEELSKVPPNDTYKIVVDKKYCGAWIVPIVETIKTEENYFDHHVYLSTHTFYDKHYKDSTKILQQYGFDVEIVNLDKEEK